MQHTLQKHKPQDMAAITASSTGAGFVPEFQYEPLPNPETHIRLLEIKPSKTKLGRKKYRCRYGSVADHEDDTVECLMTVWRIDDIPEYTAISYTWGEDDRSSDRTVLINARRVSVGKNCDESLRQARRYDGPKYCWIDGICINQTTDNGNHEKNHQVRIMGDIYRNASHVLACVGPCDKTSHSLFSMVERPVWPRGFFAHAHKWSWEWLWVVYGLGPVDFTFLLMYSQFLKRDYFHRVWILQELFLARRVTMSCGSHFVTAEDLYGYWRLVKGQLSLAVTSSPESHSCYFVLQLAGQKRMIPCSKEHASFKGWIAPRFVIDMWFIPVDHLSLATSSPEELLTLEEAFSQVGNLKCSDPRDRIYGIMSMVGWGGLDHITPDYNKPRLELAAEILLALWIEEAEQLWEVGEEVISALAMRLGDMDVTSAISARRSGITAPVPVLINESQPMDNVRRLPAVFKCKGKMICEEDDWILEPHLQSTEQDAQQDGRPNGPRYQIIRSKKTGKVIGFVPEATKPGDWIITSTSSDFLNVALGTTDFTFAFVARYHPPVHRYRYYLESPAFFCIGGIKRYQPTKFSVRFDPQDLLILLLQADGLFTSSKATAHRQRRVIEMLQVRFCQVEGSSYALKNGNDRDRCTRDNTGAYEDLGSSEGSDPSEDLDNDDDGDVETESIESGW